MNTPVSFSLAKLLKEKGFDNLSEWAYQSGKLVHDSRNKEHKNWNKEKHVDCTAPTIAEVVMWLYEKHNLWILPLPTITGYFAYKIVDVQLNPDKPIERPPYKDVSAHDYSTPTEAYEAAIEYVLNNFVKPK